VISGLSKEVQQKLDRASAADARPGVAHSGHDAGGDLDPAGSPEAWRSGRKTSRGLAHEPAAQLAQGLALGIALPAPAQQKLLAYARCSTSGTGPTSLTAMSDPALAVSHHLLDSLASCLSSRRRPARRRQRRRHARNSAGHRLSGTAVVLLDSNSKKTAFLQQVAIELGLIEYCRTLRAGRSVSAGDRLCGDHRARLLPIWPSSCSYRATCWLADGHWLAMKGVWPQDEIARLPAGVRVDGVHRLAVPGVEGERHLVVMSIGHARN
jgi:16S rRNA (guanine527-N7)-methyltransferase